MITITNEITLNAGTIVSALLLIISIMTYAMDCEETAKFSLVLFIVTFVINILEIMVA